MIVVLLVGAALQLTGAIDVLPDRSRETRNPGAEQARSSDRVNRGELQGRSLTPSGPPRRLRIVTHPAGAKVMLRGDDGFARAATTPYRGWVKGSGVTVSVALPGYNSLTERIGLDTNRSLELWLDPKGLLHHKVGELRTGSAPKQVAFSPDGGEIWATLLGESGVEVYDAKTFKRRAEIDTGAHGTVEVIFSRDGATAFVSQMQTASVFEIDRKTYRVRRRLRTRSTWSKVMTLSPDEKTLYVANWSGDNVTEINLETGRVRRQLPCVKTPRGLFVTPDGKRLFVAGYERGELQRINLETGASKVLLTTGGAMRHLTGDARTGRLFAGDMGTDEVFVVELAKERVRKLADTDDNPNTIDLTPDSRVLYVSNRGANNPQSYALPGPEWGTVLAIDTASGKILDAVVAGNQTTGLDVSSDGRLLAFSDFLDNRISVYEVPPYDVLARGDGGRADERVGDLEKAS